MTNYTIKNDCAVSPVVGVMLMLVVTIIIAAVVSAFAGGFATGATKTPQATIQIQTSSSSDARYTYNTFDISFIHKGGDPIPTKDVEIITWLTLPNGTVIEHKQSPNSPALWESGATASAAKYAKIPYIYDIYKYGSANYRTTDQSAAPDFETPPNWFGQYTFTEGMTMRTYSKNATAAFLGLVNQSDAYPVNVDASIAGSSVLDTCIQQSCSLEVKWLHVPSGKYILDQNIVLRG